MGRRPKRVANPTPPPEPMYVDNPLFDASELDGERRTSVGSGRRAGDALPRPMYRATHIAKTLGVSDMFISRLMRKPGAPYADAMGRYDLYEVIEFLQTGRRADSESAPAPVTQNDIMRAKLRSLNARSASDEYALEVRRGEHVPTSTVLDILADVFASFRRVLRALPAEIQRQTASGVTDATSLSTALGAWVAGQERTMDAELSSSMNARINTAIAMESEDTTSATTTNRQPTSRQ